MHSTERVCSINKPDFRLHLIFEGIHTYLVLPSTSLVDRIPQLNQTVRLGKLIKIGWGDYHYYGADHQPLWLAAKALLTPTASVISIQQLDSIHDADGDAHSIYSIDISGSVLSSIIQFISWHFSLDSSGQLNLVRQKSCGTQFFKSRGTYSLLNTCNNWTSYCLMTAGLPLKPQLCILSGQIERCMRKHGYQPIAV
ncbi:MAG: DUF2459 domain-containing protein [Porticoccaceae bacterium]